MEQPIEQPSQPEQPQPEQPQPDQPSQPESSSQPEQPSQPESSSQPEQPSQLEPSSQHPEWFENLIANYDIQPPEAGQILQATIIRRDQDGIYIDLGMKRETMVPNRDLEHLPEEALSSLEPGSQITVMVINVPSENREIDVSISRGLEAQVWEQAKKDLESGKILTLDVVEHNRGGLIVKYENIRGFIPFSLVPELRGVRNPKRAEAIKAGLVGKPIDVKISEVDPQRRRLILSAESAQIEQRQKKLDELKKGQILTGSVVKVIDFGAFVDLGGIDGLIHVSQLSWKKVKHPSEVVKIGEEIEVKVIEVDRERQRVGLSRKALLPGPWQTLPDELKAGDYVEAIVTRLVDFGAFAKLPQGVEGLIHTSQIGYSSHQNAQGAIKPGDRVLLKVLDVKPERKRVALSMRQVPMERQIAWAMEKAEEPSPAAEESAEPSAAPALEEPASQPPEASADLEAQAPIAAPDQPAPPPEAELAEPPEPEAAPVNVDVQSSETPADLEAQVPIEAPDQPAPLP
ncbi:MAG: S1 RNA-binding domain-containing protein, partial [Anaerolineae bacterium]|nr:S1 RNA-binding domain-containing protein [Anaerolineae bacterium]